VQVKTASGTTVTYTPFGAGTGGTTTTSKDGGAVTVNPDGTFTYTPKPDDTNSTDSFLVNAAWDRYTVTDTVTVPIVSTDPIVGTWVDADPTQGFPLPGITIRKVGNVYTETLDGPYYTFNDMAAVSAGLVVATFTRTGIDAHGNPTYTGTITAEYIAAWNAANKDLYADPIGAFSRTIGSSSVTMNGVLYSSNLPSELIEDAPTDLDYSSPDGEPFVYPAQNVISGGWIRDTTTN
jgi:hypothetical protein